MEIVILEIFSQNIKRSNLIIGGIKIMALKRMIIDGYGQLELNQVAFPRDGRIEAQCALAKEDFALDRELNTDKIYAECGMLLVVNNVTRRIELPTEANVKNYPVALNYSTEHMYDERDGFSLRNFYLPRGRELPRMGYLSVQDKFTTNCICYDSNEWDDDAVLMEDLGKINETPIYGGVAVGAEKVATGAIKLSKTKPAYGPILLVTKKTTMPDGQAAVKLQCIGIGGLAE